MLLGCMINLYCNDAIKYFSSSVSIKMKIGISGYGITKI